MLIAWWRWEMSLLERRIIFERFAAMQLPFSVPDFSYEKKKINVPNSLLPKLIIQNIFFFCPFSMSFWDPLCMKTIVSLIKPVTKD